MNNDGVCLYDNRVGRAQHGRRDQISLSAPVAERKIRCHRTSAKCAVGKGSRL